MAWVSEKNKDIIPYTTDANGNYDDRSSEEKEWNYDDGLNWWTNGFWGGIMWLLYQDTKEEKYAQIARVFEESGDPRFRQIAMMHADTEMENFIRPDGSVCHIVEFDPEPITTADIILPWYMWTIILLRHCINLPEPVSCCGKLGIVEQEICGEEGQANEIRWNRSRRHQDGMRGRR